nr:DNA-binding protein [uncultured Aminipila sp.]
MVRIRTIQQAAAEIKKADENTAVTEFYIRQLVNNGEIPTRKSGGKYLINMDILLSYLQEPFNN